VTRQILSTATAALLFIPAISLFAQPSFTLNSTFNVGGPLTDSFMTAADVNKDGRPDVFAAHGAALNRGDGTMNNVVSAGSLAVARQIAAADVNGDGFIDFVIPDFTLQTITFVTNNSGTLVPGQSLSLAGLVPTPVFPTAISADDVNGDGLMDLAVASRQPTGPLIILTNGGSGSFAAAAVVTNGIFGPVWIRLADINGDHLPDLICGDLSNSVIVFTNSAGTNFVQSCVVSNLFGVSPSIVRSVGDVVDVNGDGRPDLLCPSFSTNSALNFLKVATNAGNGVFVAASSLTVSALATNQPRGEIVIAADFNLDGKMDCVFQSEPDDRFVVATNRGDGTFAIARTILTGSPRLGIAVADVNGDGKPDVISGDSTGLAQVYLNTTPTPSPQLYIASSGAQSNVIYWTGPAGQFDLQFTTNAASTNWQNVTDGVPVTGLMVSNGAPAIFFRLQTRP
jgi:hypothetical protein